MNFDSFIDLPQVMASIRQRKADSAQCICPCHDDKKASLTVSRGRNGGVVLHDHAGCSNENIVETWGLNLRDLMPDTDRSDGERWRRYVEGRMKKNIEAVYHYVDTKTGQYAFTRLRMSGKDFVYGMLQNDCFTFGLQGRQRKDVPAVYCKSFTGLNKAISEGKRIFYAEGEKDVNTLASRGYAAVTCGAAKDWTGNCVELFRGADVVVLADNDEPGMKSAKKIECDLKAVAKFVKVVVPCPDVPKADVSDFFSAGRSDEEFEALLEGENKEIIEFKESSENNKFKEINDFSANAGELDRFHLHNDKGKITGVFDFAIFEYLKEKNDLFVLGGTPYLYEGGVFIPDDTGAKLKTLIRNLIYPELIKSTTIKRIYELFITAAELEVSFEDVNRYPAHWINFRNGFYDPKTGRMEPHSPEYRAINQIPHEFRQEDRPEGAEVEAWLQFICEKADDREMLLQFAGYSLTLDVSQQKFLVLNGEGGSGKSTVIRMIEAMTGSQNVSNISLSELQQRFASFGLMGKLLNSCADLEITALENTSTLKKCLGEDTLRGERKGHDAISFRSYAKLVFSTNELPLVKAEKTNGFYRRLLVLPMNRVPEQKRSDLFTELSGQLDYFIRLSVEALRRMYQTGTITESRASVAAVNQLRCDSDTVQAFLEEETSRKDGGRVERGALFMKYDNYCRDMDRTALSRNNFYKSMRTKGYKEIRLANGRYFGDIVLEKIVTNVSGNVSQDGFITIPEAEQEELPFD